ncbi:HNH endonuclease signature motif containing protein [Phenylobacterium sp.]|uniref:HNH endonuclease signature motif containing protein n=1 Tax=Phenylobacterium sp. TaxID=1871053 RepID=UPI0035AD7AF2
MSEDAYLACKPIDATTAAVLMTKIRASVVEADSGCLEWTGALNKKGYGITWLSKSSGNLRVHRVAYVAAKGEIPRGLVIDHLCRNRRCCNPEHMEVVTLSENSRRSAQTFCRRGHPLTGRNAVPDPRGGRSCRECRNIAARKKWAEGAHLRRAAISPQEQWGMK